MGDENRAVYTALQDGGFADDIDCMKQGTGIYVEKGNREQVLKNLPGCFSLNGWIKLNNNTRCMYTGMLNDLIASERVVVIALRNQFRKVFPWGKISVEKLETGVTIGNSNTDQVILISPEALTGKILLHELVHAWRNVTGQTFSDVLADENETNRIQKIIEKEMEKIT